MTAVRRSDQLLVKEAAALLRVHPNTVRNWVHIGFLTDVRVPGSRHIRLDRREVEAVAQRRANPRTGPNPLYARLDALCRLLQQEGHMTPQATRQILAVVEHEH